MPAAIRATASPASAWNARGPWHGPASPSLRFDFAGLGDSIHYHDGADIQTDPFTQDRTADINAAMDALGALGFTRFALHGLCSGAYSCAAWRLCRPARHNARRRQPCPGSRCIMSGRGRIAWRKGCMDRLSSRGVASLFLFGDKDPGLKPFERHFGAGGRSLPVSSAIHFRTVPGLDHELTVGWMRQTVAARIVDFIPGAGRNRNP